MTNYLFIIVNLDYEQTLYSSFKNYFSFYQNGGLGKIRYALLSDINKEVSRNYEVLLEKEGIALRGMFIIDETGILRHITINDLPIGRSVDEALRLIEAIQFVDKHGEGIFFNS